MLARLSFHYHTSVADLLRVPVCVVWAMLRHLEQLLAEDTRREASANAYGSGQMGRSQARKWWAILTRAAEPRKSAPVVSPARRYAAMAAAGITWAEHAPERAE